MTAVAAGRAAGGAIALATVAVGTSGRVHHAAAVRVATRDRELKSGANVATARASDYLEFALSRVGITIASRAQAVATLRIRVCICSHVDQGAGAVWPYALGARAGLTGPVARRVATKAVGAISADALVRRSAGRASDEIGVANLRLPVAEVGSSAIVGAVARRALGPVAETARAVFRGQTASAVGTG